jgi:chloramphenicol 3-O phosphotransferase
MTIGNIIILNGTSSSGKTSILKALQTLMDEPYLDAGIDKFIWMLPKRYLDVPLWQEVFEYTWSGSGADRELAAIHAGPRGHALMSGMHRSIAALARAGNHVLADHVLLEPAWVRECAGLFADLPAWFVGVRCPLDVLETREKSRRDRTLGQARAQFHAAHVHGLYDLEVDTSKLSPQVCAEQIRQRMIDGSSPSAFRRLRDGG